MLIRFNKPYGVLCQFTGPEERENLSHYIDVSGVYPAGRLDADSEGLILLTDDGRTQHRISDPRHKQPKRYWVQVEGVPSDAALAALRRGVEIKGARTRPAKARLIEAPEGLWARNPPIRTRLQIPTTWLELTLEEGRNRQVRRMTASVGHPTLRLIRESIGGIRLDHLRPGEWAEVNNEKNHFAQAATRPNRRKR